MPRMFDMLRGKVAEDVKEDVKEDIKEDIKEEIKEEIIELIDKTLIANREQERSSSKNVDGLKKVPFTDVLSRLNAVRF